ncbi:MAG: DEAD/DEAH box helicase family protein [Candidatus Heimdallarchaeum aukensis]|uniref:DEAD/DEAH box helicase family protein n=1 Tax=Candidatus Heimdallarchaeum aukensis TaxID=2876573 RepID=A0A9Y1FMJ5_9ARCH|nr:MAG: DEAD/DEAH box helicase family protein [Candidatus Heimdallarchaeum aukensis]
MVNYEKKINRIAPLIYGEALEFGFFLGIASKSKCYNIKPFVGIRIEPPILDIENRIELNSYLENVIGIQIEQAIDLFIRKSSITDSYLIFKNYFQKRQMFRTDLKIDEREITDILEEQKVGYTALRMIKTGFQCSISVLLNANLEWKKPDTELEIFIEPTFREKKPDFIIIRKKTSNNQEEAFNYEMNQIEFLCIGDIKSYIFFVNMTKERLLQDYIEQLIVEDFSKEKLRKLNLHKNKKIPARDFYRIATALQKYLKVFSYAQLYYNETQNYNSEIEVQIVLPGAISSFHIKSETDLRKILRFLCNLIPSTIVETEFGKKKEYILEDFERRRIFELFMSGKISMRIKEKNNKRMYFFEGTRGEELKIILKDEKTEFIEAYPETKEKIQPSIVKRQSVTRNEIENVRKEHEKNFLKLLTNDCYNIIINGSSQGVGKNYVIANYIKKLAKTKKNFTILYFCPRITTLIQTKDKIQRLIKNDIEKNVHLELIIGKREKELIRDPITLKGYETIFSETGNRLKKALEKQGQKVILVSSQALDYFLKQSYNWKLLFTKTYMFIFDELTNSGPTVAKNFIDLLIEARNRLMVNNNINVPRFVITDASITSMKLVISMLNTLVDPNSKKWMTQFQITNFNEDIQEPEEFKIINTPIKGIFLRYLLNFNIDYCAASFICEGKYEEEINFKKIFEILDKLVKKSRIDNRKKSFEKYLQEGKVIFYVNNKQFVDSLVEYLHLNNYDAVSITHDSRDTLLIEETPKKNIVGTSSLAFGTTYSWHEILIILPPFPLKTDYGSTTYFDSMINLEYFRQVIKRMRGEETDLKPRLVSMISALNKNATLKDQNIKFHQLRSFIRDILINNNEHVLPVFSRSKISERTKRKFSLFGRVSKRAFSVDNIYLDDFLKNYFPSIKTALNHFRLYPSPEFILTFNEAGRWNDMTIPSYLFYKVTNQQIAKGFRVTVKAYDKTDKQEILNYLEKPRNLYTINKGLNYLEKMVRTYYGRNVKKDEKSRKYPSLYHFINSTNNAFSLAKKFSKLLSPPIIFAGDSYLLITLDIIEDSDIFLSEDIEKATIERLRALSSPLSSIYFGDMSLLEEPMRVIIESGNFKSFTYGYVVSHPMFGKIPKQVHTLLGEALSFSTLRKNVFLLPKIIKYLSEN